MEEVEVIDQIVGSMSDALDKFEKANQEEDTKKMKELKSFLLKLQIELEETLNG